MTKRQPLFDEYEAALTLDAYLQIVNGKKKTEVQSELSKILRQKGANQGRDMNESYRNEAGMAWQLEYMKGAWTGEYKETMKPSRLFMEIVDLYRNDRTKYEELLQKARELSREPEENHLKVAEEYEPIDNFIPSTAGQAKKDIIRITIDSYPGFCRADEGYEEELTIEPTGIRYYRKPGMETGTNPSIHWSYHTGSEKFRELFETLVPFIRKVLSKSEGVLALDAPGRGIQITYSDHTSEGNAYTLMPQEYKEAAAVIRKMIPKFEEKPELLKFNG